MTERVVAIFGFFAFVVVACGGSDNDGPVISPDVACADAWYGDARGYPDRLIWYFASLR